jgi:hypothetical protein
MSTTFPAVTCTHANVSHNQPPIAKIYHIDATDLLPSQLKITEETIIATESLRQIEHLLTEENVPRILPTISCYPHRDHYEIQMRPLFNEFQLRPHAHFQTYVQNLCANVIRHLKRYHSTANLTLTAPVLREINQQCFPAHENNVTITPSKTRQTFHVFDENHIQADSHRSLNDIYFTLRQLNLLLSTLKRLCKPLNRLMKDSESHLGCANLFKFIIDMFDIFLQLVQNVHMLVHNRKQLLRAAYHVHNDKTITCERVTVNQLRSCYIDYVHAATAKPLFNDFAELHAFHQRKNKNYRTLTELNTSVPVFT